MNLNKVTLIGRLTKDPQTRALPSGQQVTSFTMATDRFFTDKNNEKQQQAEFHNIVAFGKLAEIASQYLIKGALTYVEGRLQTRTWQDTSGVQKYKTEIVAERLQLGPKSANIGNNRTPQTTQAPDVNPNPPQQNTPQEEIPIIEEDEINVKDLPF